MLLQKVASYVVATTCTEFVEFIASVRSSAAIHIQVVDCHKCSIEAEHTNRDTGGG